MKIEHRSCRLNSKRENNVFAFRTLSEGLLDEGSQS